MSEKDKEKKTFSTGSGLHQFIVMPFGLYNVLATFERVRKRVIVGLPWQILLSVLDDVIVHGKSFEEAARRRSANLKLKEMCFAPGEGYLFGPCRK